MVSKPSSLGFGAMDFWSPPPPPEPQEQKESDREEKSTTLPWMRRRSPRTPKQKTPKP